MTGDSRGGVMKHLRYLAAALKARRITEAAARIAVFMAAGDSEQPPVGRPRPPG